MRSILLIVCFMIRTWPTSAQLIEPITLRLSTLDEFISLFNGTPEKNELFGIYPVLIKQDRSRIIEGLCDVIYPLDPEVQKQLTDFSTHISLNRSQISYNDIRTFVIGYYRDREGKEVEVEITIRPLPAERGEGRNWTIEQVESSYFTLGDTARSALPTPFDNEVGFTALLREGTDYREKVEPGYQPDYRSLFLYLTSNGSLKLSSISPLNYKILIDDYSLWVSYRQRPHSALAGWKITRLDKQRQTIFKSTSP